MAKKAKTAAEKRHHDRIADLPCVMCGSWPVCVHHVISDGFQRITKDHRFVLPVCPECHQYGPNAVHVIGSRRFNELLGFNQLDKARELWEEWRD